MIFPKPKFEEYFEQNYILKNSIAYSDTFELYKKYKSGNEDLSFIIDSCLSTDEYILCVDDNGIHITVSSETGKFRAFATLRQLLHKNNTSLKYCIIKDKPDFLKRGYMLDISRCRMPKTGTIKKIIDILADLKYNEFQLYMESFCFKYSAYPEYTKDFDCLTSEDIEELDSYCSERFIELVPNQNCLGHMRTWLAQPEFSHLEVTDGVTKTATINPLEEETLKVVDKIFGSLLPHFKSKYVNVGLDEAYGLGKFQLENICREKGIDNVFMDYLEKINTLTTKKYGKNIMFWNDMISAYPNSFERIPENAIVLNWGYDLIKSTLMEKKCMELQDKNVTYYVCPGNSTWLSFTGRFDVMSFNLRTFGEIGRKYGAKGYLLTDWGCGEGHMHFPVWSLIPCALASQYSWNTGREQNGENIKNEFIKQSMDYVDEYIIGNKASNFIYKLQLYYLLEPMRIHSSTMCGIFMRASLTETEKPGWFDLKDISSDFYFDNVIEYVNKVLREVYTAEIGEQFKREIIINAKMVIMATEFMKIRMNGKPSRKKIDYLIELIDWISEEYKELWLRLNYEKGMEDFLLQLDDKRAELLSMR